ncbi:hypothetical protein Cni_G05781 [Canna indica]|uniref:BZIP domain-containing protein n=1 Tax=Canna indica TaxID=4628 RepID=A0AAQ3Q438_9LILI|nr:hypothetical protein Cni_G05781 [Canna indica]
MLSLDDLLDLSWFDAEPSPSPPTPAVPVSISASEQRRLRRKISNRESARRCRMRKQRHLEDLRAESTRLRSKNRDLSARVAAVATRCLLLRRANGRLRAESVVLRRRLAELRRLVLLQKLLMAVPSAVGAARGGAFGGFTC